MSFLGITLPMYFFTRSGYSLIASEIEQNIIPFLERVSLKVVATETESTTMSTATPANFFCSFTEIPSFSNVFNNSGSTSSKLSTYLLI